MIELLAQLEDHANLKYDGHYTVLKFTTGFKVSFGTITDREEIDSLVNYETLKKAIVNLLINEGI